MGKAAPMPLSNADALLTRSLGMLTMFLRALSFVLAFLALAAMAVGPRITVVHAGEDLQHALDNAAPADTIVLEAAAVFVGNFVLPAKSGSDMRPIVLKTAGDVIPQGTRMTPDMARTLAKLQSPNNQPALRTERGARSWRVELVELRALDERGGEIVALGDGSDAQRALADVPSDLTLDRVYVHGEPTSTERRGISLNAARVTITNSYVSDIKGVGYDTQAIGGWNGPGDYLIENNYLEAAGENVMFGGGDPSIRNLTPTHIVIRRNTFSKPLRWRDEGARWQIKNLFELKNARDVTVEQNVFEHNWQQAQSGYAIVLTVRNQDGGCPWCQVEQVRFRHNIVRDVAAGLQILGIDATHPSRQTNAIVIADNLFENIDSRRWGGDGYFLQLTDTPRDILIDHNTVVQQTSGGVVKIEGIVEAFTFTNNIASHGAYGIIATNHGVGNDSIRASLPRSTITANVLAGGDANLYPSGNLFPTPEELGRQFVNVPAGDFRLVPASAWARRGTDGRPLGADVSQLPAAGR